MNRRIGIVLSMLLIAGSFTLYGAQSSGQMERKAIKLPNKFVNAPFSDGIVFGDTLYLAGRIGIDPKTGKVPEKIEDEIKLLLDGEKDVLAQAGMTMDDLAYVQVFCTDLSLFRKVQSDLQDVLHKGLSGARVYRRGLAAGRRTLRIAGHCGETPVPGGSEGRQALIGTGIVRLELRLRYCRLNTWRFTSGQNSLQALLATSERTP